MGDQGDLGPLSMEIVNLMIAINSLFLNQERVDREVPRSEVSLTKI